jgi:hypothetical protein
MLFASSAFEGSRVEMMAMKDVAALTVVCGLALALSLLFKSVDTPFFSDEPTSDLLEERMKELAPGAINCGRVGIRLDPRQASKCAMDAFKSKKSFQVRYDLQGIDSNVAVGWVSTAAGAVIAISFDGDPTGRGGTSASRQRVDERACPQPVKLFASPQGRLNCFPPDPNAKRNIMSPTFQPY